MRVYQKLFLYLFGMMLLLLAAITYVQYQREKSSRAELLNEVLQNYNKIISNYLEDKNYNWEELSEIVEHFPDTSLRVTVVDTLGNVLFDTSVKETSHMENHKERPEFLLAATNDIGTTLRKSETTGIEYYYLAGKFSHYYIRSALPYGVKLKSLLKTNVFFGYFMSVILLLAILGIYVITRNFTKSIDRMRIFTEKAKNGEEFDVDVEFPSDELGEISSNMVTLYKQLAKTKNEVINEREKLINHLYISQEGLGIFSSEKKEILTNPIFIQYTSYLSDKNEATSNEIFNLPEFNEINSFIDENLHKRQMRRKRMTIEKGGRYFFVQCIVFQDETFEIVITDTTTMEQENELKRQLTQNISHELRTPVSTIMGYMESILENPSLEPERQMFFIERSYQQSQRLTALIQDIAILNKLDERRKVYEKEECSLLRILQEVLKDLRLEIEKKKFKVSHNLDETIIVKGNSSLLYSIIRNLMDNALDYAGENIQIEINCYREDERFYYFTFSDNGNGVSEEHLNRIFERFYRVDKGRSRKMGGTGLGLAIVKNAILFHKGNITAKKIPGGGLSFVFSLKKK
ncbi:MAG TPA: two-component sensor histidine kinase [Bacteroidales bacterium]|nr:two-component sensor histidine kinase [Bacteroidales bacterium]